MKNVIVHRMITNANRDALHCKRYLADPKTRGDSAVRRGKKLQITWMLFFPSKFSTSDVYDGYLKISGGFLLNNNIVMTISKFVIL